MKKIILLCMVSIISTTSIFAISEPGASEKILKLFRQEFPNIDNPVFYDYGDSYMVYFKNKDESVGRVYYNLNGTISKTVKYYSGDKLEPFIHEKVTKQYKGRTIFGVTEVISSDEHFYQIVLEDASHWYKVFSDDTGSMRISQKLKKP